MSILPMLKYELTDEDRELLRRRFQYHRPHGDQVERYQWLRDEAHKLARGILQLTPRSREQSLALTKLEEAIMFANAAIARNEDEAPETLCLVDQVKQRMDLDALQKLTMHANITGRADDWYATVEMALKRVGAYPIPRCTCGKAENDPHLDSCPQRDAYLIVTQPPDENGELLVSLGGS